MRSSEEAAGGGKEAVCPADRFGQQALHVTAKLQTTIHRWRRLGTAEAVERRLRRTRNSRWLCSSTKQTAAENGIVGPLSDSRVDRFRTLRKAADRLPLGRKFAGKYRAACIAVKIVTPQPGASQAQAPCLARVAAS